MKAAGTIDSGLGNGRVREAREVLRDLDRAIEAATPGDLPALALALSARLAVATARIVRTAAPSSPPPSGEDGNLDVDGAARRLGVSRAYLYRHAAQLPFAVRIGRRLLFSAAGLEQWNRRRQRRG